MVHAKVVAAYRGDIVGLAGVRVSIVSREQDALLLEVLDALVDRDLGVVLEDTLVSFPVQDWAAVDAAVERTWFSSQMVMNLSNPFPGTILASARPRQTAAPVRNQSIRFIMTLHFAAA